MKDIELAGGFKTIVDDEDYERVVGLKWYVAKRGKRCYAVRNLNGKQQYLHQLILNASDGLETDHRYGNGLDNRRENLRFCTHQQNMWNQRKQVGMTSKYKGVAWAKHAKRWRATIVRNGHQFHLGYFFQEIEAAREYDAAAKKLFGSFAATNF